MKVGYKTLRGAWSKAYLDYDGREGEEVPDVLTGTDKHNDDPITVRWTDEGWVQIEA